MRRILYYLFPSLFLIPAVAMAVSFTEVSGRYSDTNSLTTAERAGVNVLTNLGAISGNPDGTFAPDRPVNRAEFTKIALLSAEKDISVPTHDCFPDVRHDQWFSDYVCEAKDRGIVEGNPDGLFHPERTVNYAEAVKILVTLHGYSLPLPPPNERWTWYRAYILAAESFGVQLSGTVGPEEPLSRGETVRLAAAFAAQADGQLDEYRRAERGEVISSSSSSRSNSSSSRSSVSSNRSSSRSSMSSSRTSNSRSSDPLADDSVTSNTFVSLGVTTPILASGRVFMNLEPLQVTDVTIDATGTAAIDSFLVYNDEGLLLGTATRSGNLFNLHLKDDDVTVPRNEERTFYVRARLESWDDIHDSGEEVRVNSVTFKGTGEWSNEPYEKMLTGNFPTVVTARERITEISAQNSSSAALLSDTSLTLLRMRVRASNNDPGASAQLQEVSFNVSATNVTLSNVRLTVPDTGTSSSCSVAGSTITCSSIPSGIGTVDTEKTYELRGDTLITGGATNARLQVFLDDGGSTTSAGDVLWTDGTSTFNWVPYSRPVVVGTSFTME